jgi:hypothetical protein
MIIIIIILAYVGVSAPLPVTVARYYRPVTNRK